LHCRLQDQIQKLEDEISEKKDQIRVLEQQIIEIFGMTPYASDSLGMPQVLSKLTMQLNEKIFEHEVLILFSLFSHYFSLGIVIDQNITDSVTMSFAMKCLFQDKVCRQ
jgi:hypothetical protein